MRLDLKKMVRPALVTALVLCALATRNAAAEVNLSVGVNLGPPPVVVTAPPEMVLMPNHGVYFAPGVSFDVFFYNGYWWSPRGDRWYRGTGYNGPWRVMEPRYVPRVVRSVPGDYRGRYAHERHIPYGQWKKEHGRHGGGRGHGGEAKGHGGEAKGHGGGGRGGHGREYAEGGHGGGGEGHGHGHGH